MFRSWLERHHDSKRELVLRCFKRHAESKGISYREALDEALCFGWIDGVRHALDGDSFTVRFTPRKAKSYWSAVNTKRFHQLEAEGRVRPPGLAVFRARVNPKSATRYSFESKTRRLAPAYARELRASRKAWAFFQAQPPWYRRTSAFWVMSAKQERTRARRLGILIACSERGKAIGPLARPSKR